MAGTIFFFSCLKSMQKECENQRAAALSEECSRNAPVHLLWNCNSQVSHSRTQWQRTEFHSLVLLWEIFLCPTLWNTNESCPASYISMIRFVSPPHTFQMAFMKLWIFTERGLLFNLHRDDVRCGCDGVGWQHGVCMEPPSWSLVCSYMSFHLVVPAMLRQNF